MKPFKSLDGQIELLEKRNLTFANKNEAKTYLLRNNYYNVINCYSKFFLDDREKYLSGTDFRHITEVHHFDKEIKSSFFKAIIEAEKTFKSIFAYRYSERFKDIPYAYLNIANYDSQKTLEVSQFISQLSKVLLNNKNKKNHAIAHYINHHGDVPIWVLINYLTFGQLSMLYSFMPDDIQNQVAKDLGEYLKVNTGDYTAIVSPDELESYLRNIVDLRNIIAHNNKLLGFRCRRNAKHNDFLYPPSYDAKRAERSTPYHVYVSLQCFLSYQEFAQLNNAIRKRMEKLTNKIGVEYSNKVFAELGFPPTIARIDQSGNPLAKFYITMQSKRL